MKRRMKIEVGITIAIVAITTAAFAVMTFDDYLQAYYFKAVNPPPGQSIPDGDGVNAQLNQTKLWFTNSADEIIMGNGDDAISLSAGQDFIAMGPDGDVIAFGATTDTSPGPSAAITFDAAGSGSVNAALNNSQEYIRSESPNAKGASKITIRSHDILLSTHGGNVTFQLDAEY